MTPSTGMHRRKHSIVFSCTIMLQVQRELLIGTCSKHLIPYSIPVFPFRFQCLSHTNYICIVKTEKFLWPDTMWNFITNLMWGWSSIVMVNFIHSLLKGFKHICSDCLFGIGTLDLCSAIEQFGLGRARQMKPYSLQVDKHFAHMMLMTNLWPH